MYIFCIIFFKISKFIGKYDITTHEKVAPSDHRVIMVDMNL